MCKLHNFKWLIFSILATVSLNMELSFGANDTDSFEGISPENVIQNIIKDPSRDDLAQNYILYCMTVGEPNKVPELFAKLSTKQYENTPANTRLSVGMIEYYLVKKDYEKALALLIPVCKKINENPDDAQWSRMTLTSSIHSKLPSFDKEDPNELTKRELLMEISQNLKLEPSKDWLFFMNYAVWEIAEEKNLDNARYLLDTVEPYLPPEEYSRWFYNSAHLNFKLGNYDLATEEIAVLEDFCKNTPNRYCDFYVNPVSILKREIREKRDPRSKPSRLKAEVDELVQSSLDSLPSSNGKHSSCKINLKKKIFIPKVVSDANTSVCVLDFSNSKILKLDGVIDSASFSDEISKKEIGDIAWDGYLIVLRGANLKFAQEQKNLINYKKGESIAKFKLSNEIKLPSDFIFTTKSNSEYLLTIHKIQCNGIWITYKKL